MTFQISDLEELGNRLQKRRDVLLAQAKEYDAHGETKKGDLQRMRADSANFYASVCDHFSKVLKAKERAKKFEPPTLNQVREFCIEEGLRWPENDVRGWYDHFQSNGWKVSGKTVMKDWKAAVRNGFRNYCEKKGINPNKPQGGGDDPPEWCEFLASIDRPYRAYKYALEHVKEDYRKWMKNQ